MSTKECGGQCHKGTGLSPAQALNPPLAPSIRTRYPDLRLYRSCVALNSPSPSSLGMSPIIL